MVGKLGQGVGTLKKEGTGTPLRNMTHSVKDKIGT